MSLLFYPYRSVYSKNRLFYVRKKCPNPNVARVIFTPGAWKSKKSAINTLFMAAKVLGNQLARAVLKIYSKCF